MKSTKEIILSQSLAVRTPMLYDVFKTANTINPDYNGIKQFKTDIIKWLEPIIDLNEFFVYPMNGITEGLNWWYHTDSRGILVNRGDYQWISPRVGDSYIKYISVPSAIDGNIRNIPTDIPIALDLAYVGSTEIRKIEMTSNIEYVFYSLSKSFGVRNIRTGWLFCRQPDDKLNSLIYSAKYYNYYAQDVAEKIINSFDIDYIHNLLYQQQINICEKLDMKPSDSVWLATTPHKDYSKFRRSKDSARICLAGVYEI